MKERVRKAIAECRLIASMTEELGESDGVLPRTTRRFLTAPMHDVHRHLRSRMEMLGMQVEVDAVGNLRGVWQPDAGMPRRLLVGSHVDTVPHAGAFDGVLGVVLAIEMVAMARELHLPFAIEVIAFSEEEGVRFGAPFLGSRAVAGRFDSALLELTDAEGVRMEDAIRAFGLDPAEIGAAELSSDAIGFFEIHIEQGPVLDAEGLPVAAVTVIAGQTRLNLTFVGQPNHAGTTPMHLRRDALAAAAAWMVEVEALAQRRDGLVATVGRISAEPNATNVVPGNVQVSLDVRHAVDAVRVAAVEELVAKAGAIAAARSITLERTNRLDQPAVPMDERLSALLTEAIEAAGYPNRSMASGAGHDAMVMAAKIPAAMLFLRTREGISHHPAEMVYEEDIEAALNVGCAFLKRLAGDVG